MRTTVLPASAGRLNYRGKPGRRPDHRSGAAPLGFAELTGLVREIADEPALWNGLVRYPEGADRWWRQLSASPQVDVWLLSWLPGQTTELHDHGGSAAAFTVVEGELDELRSRRTGKSETHHWRPGAVTWIGPQLLHDVSGGGTGPAVSIHAYSPPLTRMNYYERGPDGTLAVARSVAGHEPEAGWAR